jgi:hypothetical protein
VEILRHGVLLVFGAPCQRRLLAGQEHGQTIPLADMLASHTTDHSEYVSLGSEGRDAPSGGAAFVGCGHDFDLRGSQKFLRLAMPGNRAVCAEPRKFIKERGIKSERFIGGTSFDRFAL